MIWLFLFDVFVTKLYVVYLTGWPFLRESWILFIVHPNTFNWYPPPSALRWFRSDITQWCSKGKVSFNVNHKVRPSSRVMISDFCNILTILQYSSKLSTVIGLMDWQAISVMPIVEKPYRVDINWSSVSWFKLITSYYAHDMFWSRKQLSSTFLKNKCQGHALRACVIVFTQIHTDVTKKSNKNIQFGIFGLCKTTNKIINERIFKISMD